MKIRSAHSRLFVLLLAATAYAAAQETALKARIELTQNGHPLANAAKAVVWLTPVGAMVEPPRQKASDIPQLVQKNKMFHPSLIVIPVAALLG